MIAQIKGQVVWVDALPEKAGKEKAHRVSILTQSGTNADIGQVVVIGVPPIIGKVLEGTVQVTGYYYGKAQCRLLGSNGAGAPKL